MSVRMSVFFFVVLSVSLIFIAESFGTASANEEAEVVYLPLAFSREGEEFKTSACIVLREYSAANNFGGRGLALERVISAFESKNREVLFELSDPVSGRDPKQFESQMSGFFQAFESDDFVGIRQVFGFGGLMVFFVELQSDERSFVVPFEFSVGDGESLGFLPYGTRDLSYALFSASYNLPLASSDAAATKHCKLEVVAGATHRIDLPPLDSSHPPLSLLLRGASMDTPGELKESATQIKAAMAAIERAHAAGDIAEVAAHMTSKGGAKLKGWWEAATPAERNRYKPEVLEEPFFFFDASPLMVVYTRGQKGIHVAYFTTSVEGEVLWTNAYYGTVAGSLFKNGALDEAAALDEPFSNVKIPSKSDVR